ncbi:hypothetical protein L3055_08000 [Corynebacterium sp. MC-02]|uniref:hypothetical protein n=1 Tax=Corynebacterium pseudokroppenstedtii TaxID=2804917 RepID=UPI001F3F59C8|nr:hypothetical protein [Corynebacterium pseudokroppenstedtii]MCF8703487.1 hypothetical protein [Corynebacterium pseudokroppenstedtii]
MRTGVDTYRAGTKMHTVRICFVTCIVLVTSRIFVAAEVKRELGVVPLGTLDSTGRYASVG